MKKVVLSLAGVLAAAAFAPEASALPVFARQTGMACSACHFQHFPMLNAFGRSFKSAAFTMVGAQGKIEGDRLSIPDTLNMAVLTTAGYEKTNAAPDASGVTKNGGNGVVYVPGTNGEFSLFVGGRVSENAGFLSEIGAIGAAALGSAKLPILYPVGDSGARIGVVPFTTDGQGASYGFETLNTGANAIHQMSGVGGFNGAHGTMFSAQQYIGTGGFATGAALVANSDMGFINVTKFHQAGPADLGGVGGSLGSTYLRAAYVFDMAGWDSGVGVQSWSGSSLTLDPAITATAAMVDTKATAVDFQMQGAAGDMPVGVYVTYARAPVTTTSALGNAYNQGGTFTKSSFNVAAEIGIIPEVATLQAAIRRSKSGVDIAGTGSNNSDNAIMVGATYKLAQNMVASLSYTSASGDYWTQAQTAAVGSKTTTINLFTLF